MTDPTELATAAWPGRRAGLWLTGTGAALMVIGGLASTRASMLITQPNPASTAPGVQQINAIALWIANLTTGASLIGGVMMGLGITLFITWESILGGLTTRLDRLQAERLGQSDARPPVAPTHRADDSAWADEVAGPYEVE